MGEAQLRHEQSEYQLVISFNTVTHEFEMKGFDKDPLVALGMLKWAEHKVQRAVSKQELIEEMQKAPRIAVPNGPLG